jgi:hypothetical protein
MKKAFWILCALFIFIIYPEFNSGSQCLAQKVDSTYIAADKIVIADSVQMKKHSPKKASWLALIPGAGQIYNKKYWKLPIVYGGLGATAYLTYYYGKKTEYYRKEYVARVQDPPDYENMNPELENMPDYNVLNNRNDYRRNMEICIAVCAVVYFLSIIDASVDAHLYYYDISDNLSMGIKPKIDFNPITRVATPGLALVFKF